MIFNGPVPIGLWHASSNRRCPAATGGSCHRSISMRTIAKAFGLAPGGALHPESNGKLPPSGPPPAGGGRVKRHRLQLSQRGKP